MKYILFCLMFGLAVPILRSQQKSPCKAPGSQNLFRVNYLLNGKRQDLDTNFIIKIYLNDSLIHTVQSHAVWIEGSTSARKLERFSSLVSIPVLALVPKAKLTAEFESGNKKIRWDASDWVYRDTLLFCDCFGMNIYRYTNLKHFRKESEKRRLPYFRRPLPEPAKKDFSLILLGWQLEEFELELKLLP